MVSRDKVPLAAPYGDYEIELVADPAACVLYKNKGVSRLTMRRGALLTLEADLTVIQFGEKPGFELVLSLQPPADGELLGYPSRHGGRQDGIESQDPP